MMAVAAGVILLFAVLFGPRHGVLVKLARRQFLSLRILADDVVALLYRLSEKEPNAKTGLDDLHELLLADRFSLRAALAWLRWRGDVQALENAYQLTQSGITQGGALVRSHRLWEQYLVSEADFTPDRIHDKAEQFEHFTDRHLRDQLDSETLQPEIDPHGAAIPPEEGGKR
jgi:manganese/zinc/iron transport system permease protein